jgi:signal transduction histidine kinase/phage shock protein PspC (stress-responsive transcriptional regulator)
MTSTDPRVPPPDGAPHPAEPAGRAPGEPAAYRRAMRDSQRLVVGGVASGLAAHLALPVLWIRVAFIAATALGGLGIAMYAALWIFLPSDARFETAPPGLESASRTGKRPSGTSRFADVGPAIALGALGLGVVLAAEAVFGRGVVFWPVLLGALGLGLLLRQADEAQRERWLDPSGRMDTVRAVFGTGTWASYLRIAAGVGLVATAALVFGLGSPRVSLAGDLVLATLLGIAGLAVVVGPWVFRLASDLTAERAERIRTQERADVAAHLHDSVLQTLALIQKNAEDSAGVARLARAQERELRSWLYAGESRDAATLGGALREVAARVEDEHVCVVDVVTVGDVAMSEQLRPVVQAAREAVVNAAKHAGTGRVDVYAEVAPGQVEVFVRDRGAGFDLDAVAEDRLGVRSSILDRMRRHGGTAEVRSAPGEGTEVRLRLSTKHVKED